jgi:hypothetical protein
MITLHRRAGFFYARPWRESTSVFPLFFKEGLGAILKIPLLPPLKKGEADYDRF